MSDEMAAFGTLLGHGAGGPPLTYTPIASVRDIDGPGLKLNDAEVTHHQSPGGYEQFVGTTITPGEITFQIGYVPTDTTQTDLVEYIDNRTIEPFQLLFPDDSYWNFDALVTGFKPKAPVKGDLTAEVKMKVTGRPEFVPASSF